MSQVAPDDLTKPLGAARRRRIRLPLPPLRMVVAAFGAVVALGALYTLWTSDPLGGEPHVIVPIKHHAGMSMAAAPKAGDAPPVRTRATAAQLEQESGVQVVRPGDAQAPGSVVISVPDSGKVTLSPAPDPRLIERTRYGLLPKIGQDGARPAVVYARPAGSLPGGAQPAARIAIVVGGLGISQTATTEAIAQLPPEVTLAFAPYGTDLDTRVADARSNGHEVMLQVPMQPFDYPDNDPGPHTMTAEASPAENLDRLHWLMGRFTGYVGLMNFMGAKLTANETALTPILKEIDKRGLVFLDDGSSPRSTVPLAATHLNGPFAQADEVIDAVAQTDAIDRQLAHLEALARDKGTAVGTASALPLTISRIAAWAKTLAAKGILLEPASAAFARAKS